MGIIMFIAWYTVINGNESFFRTTQLLFIIVLGSYFLLGMLVLLKGLPNVRMLRPVLEQGLMPVVRAALPDIFSFPFTQGVIFLVFWKFAANRKAIRKTAYWGYTAGAVFIVLMNAMIVSVLGPLAAVSALPYLEVVQLVQVANFVERLDVVVTLLLFIGLYIKLTAFYLGAAIVLRELFHISYKWGAVIIGAAIYGASFLERNNTVHLWIGLGISLKVSLVMQVGIPVVLLLLAAFRIRGTKQTNTPVSAAEGKAG
jgi:spore germination protein KB